MGQRIQQLALQNKWYAVDTSFLSSLFSSSHHPREVVTRDLPRCSCYCLSLPIWQDIQSGLPVEFGHLKSAEGSGSQFCVKICHSGNDSVSLVLHAEATSD